MISEFDPEPDDDTHYCLKCHSTIIGLENYVNHKKSRCEKSAPGPSKSPLPSQLLPPDEIGLKADDFFSSLELRSSSKKPATQPPQSGGKILTGILTRSKTTALSQATSTKTSKEQPIEQRVLPDPPQSKSGKNVWIGGHQLPKELGYGDNQSKLIKAVDNLERRKEYLPKVEVFDESEEDSDEFIDYDDDSTEDEDDPSRHHTGGKWKPQSPIHWSREREWGEPSSSGGKWKPGAGKRVPSPTYTKGKWKPETKEIEMDVDPNIPPPTYTGSKWVPLKKQDYQGPSTLGYGKSKWRLLKQENNEECPPPNVKGKWKPKQDEDTPPLTHTKGKWKPNSEDVEINITSSLNQTKSLGKGKTKPLSVNETLHDSESKDDKKSATKIDTRISDHNYSSVIDHASKSELKETTPKNKNIKITDDSPFRKSSGTVQYWCSPCNRRLASKLVYERHLKSTLHFKRTTPEGEFDQGAFITKKAKLETKTVNTNVKAAVPSRKRKRRKIYEICLVCQSRVNKNMMGKHLISHYHCRKGDFSSEEATGMVLDNIKAVILESPFQCCVCRFYCNTHEQFLCHWKSDFHKANDQKYMGYFLCIFCKQISNTSEEMLLHLNSEEHLDVVSVINRSVPITIKKINELSCLTCDQKFTLNIQLLNHCRKFSHVSTNVRLFSKDSFYCQDCKRYFYTALSIQRHRRKKHKHEYFYCSSCVLQFDNAQKAKEHRASQKHRHQQLQMLKSGGRRKKKQCEYCAEVFDNFLKLKHHLKEKHPEHKIRCPHCGDSFTIPQELTNHLRLKSCKFKEMPHEEINENTLFCEKCPFTSESTSELLFHLALHAEPILRYPLDQDGNVVQIKAIPRYACPVCEQIFPKNSLRDHIRLHAKERPYTCAICGAGFVRKNNLLYHERGHLRKTKRCQIIKESNTKPFLCAVCGNGFAKSYTLQQHMLIHTGKHFKCTQAGCFYTARKQSEVTEHARIHSTLKAFSCDLCKYKGKTKGLLSKHSKVHKDLEKKFACSQCAFTARTLQHLKRHERLHTGSKPFKCPHCDYRCNIYENLRKHVISTSRHFGKSLFECKFCEKPTFKTNFSKDFKHHLVTIHAKQFSNNTEIGSYIASIYEAPDDNSHKDPAADFVESFERVQTPQPSKPNNPSEEIFTLRTKEDPFIITGQPIKEKILELPVLNMPSMFVVSKDDGGNSRESDSWSQVESYDVEESGNLVPFQNEQDELFEEHF